MDLSVRWHTPSWRAEAETWMESRLAEAGVELDGAIKQVRLKPWSIHLMAPTSRGQHWFKENCPPLRFECHLVETLSQLVPDQVLQPVAIDCERGWMLTPDGGTTLDQSATPTDAFGRVLAEYGDLQRAVIDHEAKLVVTGLPVIRARDAIDRFEQQLDDLVRLPVDHPLHVGHDVIASAGRIRHLAAESAAQLADAPIPDSLQHNDLQPTNTFVPGRGATRFFDFGDAVWGHPFCVLNVALFRMAQAWACSADDPRIGRLRDFYLEGWTSWARLGELRRLVKPAMTIARLHRYNSWHQLIPYMPESELRRHAGYAESVVFGG